LKIQYQAVIKLISYQKINNELQVINNQVDNRILGEEPPNTRTDGFGFKEPEVSVCC
jgi:hypothetical protein